MLMCSVNPGNNKPVIVKERMRGKGGKSWWSNDCLNDVIKFGSAIQNFSILKQTIDYQKTPASRHTSEVRGVKLDEINKAF